MRTKIDVGEKQNKLGWEKKISRIHGVTSHIVNSLMSAVHNNNNKINNSNFYVIHRHIFSTFRLSLIQVWRLGPKEEAEWLQFHMLNPFSKLKTLSAQNEDTVFIDWRYRLYKLKTMSSQTGSCLHKMKILSS